MATYVGDLITEVRRDTSNTDSSSTSGISDEDFLRYMNFAQRRLQGLLHQRNVTCFRNQEDISMVASQANYSVDDNVYLGESIVDVQYSRTGNETDFYEIREISESNRNFQSDDGVKAYTRRAGQIYLSPIPATASGTLRVTYDRAMDSLDLRRGDIDIITVVTGVITADTISLDITDDDDTRVDGVADKYLGIVDKDGVVQAYNIPYTSYHTASGNFTHVAHTITTSNTPAVGDYVTVGKYTSTHLQILDNPSVERYLQLYCAVKIFRRDSNDDANEAARELAAVEKEILDTYQAASKDESEIQIDDPDLYYLR